MKQRFERIDEASIHIPRADVSQVRRKWLDIAYADTSPAQKLDLYLPEEGDGPFPVIAHIHGGGFAIGDKRDVHLLPLLFLHDGLVPGFAELHGHRVGPFLGDDRGDEIDAFLRDVGGADEGDALAAALQPVHHLGVVDVCH